MYEKKHIDICEICIYHMIIMSTVPCSYIPFLCKKTLIFIYSYI